MLLLMIVLISDTLGVAETKKVMEEGSGLLLSSTSGSNESEMSKSDVGALVGCFNEIGGL